MLPGMYELRGFDDDFRDLDLDLDRDRSLFFCSAIFSRTLRLARF